MPVLVDEALELAQDLTLCGELDHRHKDYEESHLRRFVLLACAATKNGEAVKAQIYAGTAKGYLRARLCQKAIFSLSGRPAW